VRQPVPRHCHVAKDAHATLVGSLGQANAKAAALDRAKSPASAFRRLKGGRNVDRCPSMSAVWIAAQTGWKPVEVAQSIDIGFALLPIPVTQLFAALGHPAVKLIMWGVEHPPAASSELVAAEKPKVTPKPRALRAAPRKPRASHGRGRVRMDGFMSFQDQARWHHKSALEWTEEKGSDGASD
jgi:hypothetical protein